MKSKTKNRIFAVIITAAVLIMAFCGVSHAVYHRSVMASLAEIYMIAIDRDCIYEEGQDYIDNVELRAVENEKPYTKPSGVSVDIPYYDKQEHGMQVFYFNEEIFADTLIIYIPGGGFLNNPLKYHWKIINKLSGETSTPVLMPVYLKVPNHTCDESYKAMTEFYLDVASRKGVEHIILAGDSSGGSMSLVLAQLMRDEHPEALQPEQLILIAPWMDASMDNEEILGVEPDDHMLGLYGTKDLGIRWAGERGVHDPMVSPIYGTFEDLGYITMFAGTRDMLCPDIVKFSGILDEKGIEHTLVVEEGLDHPYPLFPIPEATKAQEIMIDVINAVKGVSEAE